MPCLQYFSQIWADDSDADSVLCVIKEQRVKDVHYHNYIHWQSAYVYANECHHVLGIIIKGMRCKALLHEHHNFVNQS